MNPGDTWFEYNNRIYFIKCGRDSSLEDNSWDEESEGDDGNEKDEEID